MARTDFALNSEQKADAREALRILHGTGISLEAAARKAVAGVRALKRIQVSDAAASFVLSRIRSGCRRGTSDWYEDKLRLFVARFGDAKLDEISRSEIEAWLDGRAVSDVTRAGNARAIRALWRWAQRSDPPMVGADVTIGLATTARSRGGEIKFLPVNECRAIMEGAGKYRSALALMLFAGIRPQEVAGHHKVAMTWENVNTADKIVRVPAGISKIGRTRSLEGLPETLWAWLEPKALRDDVCPAKSREAVSLASRLAGYGPDRPWPQDALRHTFASYHVAAFSDPGKTALLLGHEGNPTMLYRHYRGLATKAEAEKFWALRPSA